MVYRYIEDIPRKDLLFYLAIISGTLYLTTVIVNTQIGHVAGVILGIALIYFFNEKEVAETEDLNFELEYKLSVIKNRTLGTKIERMKKRNLTGPLEKSPLYFHYDADIINLVHNVVDFADYNEDAYFLMVKAIDNVLKLHEDIKIGVTRCTENVQNMIIFRDNALNHFHTFIYAIPSIKVIDQKYQKNMKRLQLLLQRHIDDAVRICRTQNFIRGTDVDTTFVNPGYVFINAPKPNRMGDRSYSRFDFY